MDYPGQRTETDPTPPATFPCPTPPVAGAASAESTGHVRGSHSRPVTLLGDLGNTWDAPAGVTRQLPVRESVLSGPPLKPEGPAPAFRWQKALCGWGEGRVASIPLFPPSQWWKGRKRVSFLPDLPEPLMRGKSSCVFCVFIMKDHSFSTFQSLQKTDRAHDEIANI